MRGPIENDFAGDFEAWLIAREKSRPAESDVPPDLGQREYRLSESEEDDFETWLLGLSQYLIILSEVLVDLGRREEALAAIEEAAVIVFALGDTSELMTYYMQIWSIQSGLLSDLGQREAALITIRQANAIWWVWARDYTIHGVGPYLAKWLSREIELLVQLGQFEEALPNINHAASLLRSVIKEGQQDFLPDLVKLLDNRAMVLSALGRKEEAAAARAEVTVIRGKLDYLGR